jgi:hypothetical protein
MALRPMAAVAAGILGIGGAVVAPPAQAYNRLDCGPEAKGELYVVSGWDLNCTTAKYAMDHYLRNGSAPSWTCGGGDNPGREGAWCTQPPNLRIEVD